MNKRRRHVDRLLEIARSSREWVKDLVDIGALSSEQLDKMNERLEVLDEYARLHGLNYAGARLAPRRAHRANGAAQAAPARLGGSAAASAAGCSGNTTATGTPDGRVALEGGTALLTGTPQTAFSLYVHNKAQKNISNANLSLVSTPPAKNTKIGGKKLSISSNPYTEVEEAFFEPVSSSGIIKDFDITEDIFEDKDSCGRVDYDNNLLDQIETRQKNGTLPQFDGIDWDKIQESNKAAGFENFYGGVDGGTQLSYYGEWFTDETENVVPEFAEFAIRRMSEDESGCLIESDDGSLYVETTQDERLMEYFKAIGSYNPQNEKEAIIADWLERESDERKLFFFQYLDKLQNEAKERQRQYKKAALPVYLEVKGGNWQMMPSGMGSGIKCRWRLERGGVQIGIHTDPTGTIPAVLVEFGYQALKFRKFPDVVAEVEEVLRAMGFNIETHKISRIDLQLTLDLPFLYVAEAFKKNLIVSRVKKWREIRGTVHRHDTGEELQTQYETFWGGSGKTIMIRLYDKIKECFKGPDALEKLNDLYAIMGVREHLTRVEFELRREWLKEYQIDTITDLYARMPEVLRYLTQDYFRVLDSEKNSHAEKQRLSPWWEDVQKKFELAFNATYEGKVLERIESRVFNADALIKQALGCLKSALASVGGDTMDRTEFHKTLWSFIRIHEPQLYDDYTRLMEAVRIQRERITSLQAQFDYSEILQARNDLMIDDDEGEGEAV